MKELKIRWQRLVSGGETCPRCTETGAEVEAAAAQLSRALGALGIRVALEKTELTPEAFSAAPLESNRIWIGGTPMEELLGAETGQSPCCSTCGDAECRTVEVDGRRYEAVSSELIIRAGLVAASRLLAEGGEDGPPESCCAGECS